ncbi:MAG: hypothetical protein K0S47_4352 [Herbinix sp.]|jgi:hypothetical protein|nr:hypothetical protein [Herbinix sp.]
MTIINTSWVIMQLKQSTNDNLLMCKNRSVTIMDKNEQIVDLIIFS